MSVFLSSVRSCYQEGDTFAMRSANGVGSRPSSNSSSASSWGLSYKGESLHAVSSQSLGRPLVYAIRFGCHLGSLGQRLVSVYCVVLFDAKVQWQHRRHEVRWISPHTNPSLRGGLQDPGESLRFLSTIQAGCYSEEDMLRCSSSWSLQSISSRGQVCDADTPSSQVS
jgi:hypothetical protein